MKCMSTIIVCKRHNKVTMYTAYFNICNILLCDFFMLLISFVDCDISYLYLYMACFLFCSAPWSHHNYLVHPRLRRVVTLDDQPIETTRSLKQNLLTPIRMTSINCPKRKIKIITIEDDADSNYYSKLCEYIVKLYI